ncbi:NYN domain-containing protein [Pseudonocardia sp. WMMC193]|uniref:NYN domain-containing protein n=1 Tax=Pseudonocardia sp. WMMC193 TaxID=2911965 RepID=UPI001F44D064|nr:NYN domain-containing protein [Pseudonocardia sp. WMMC193]MCF7548317.1 NYN domain-containing protein [Pseudonocardia sp. WMMC193]
MYPQDAPTPDASSSPGVDWNLLPDPVRHRLAEVAATAVGEMPTPEVPTSLRPFARFAPAKRARLGGTALVRELREDGAFRTAVVAWWEEHRPGELAAGPDEPITAAAAAVLTGAPEARAAVASVARRGDASEARAERDEALARADKLQIEVERLRAELAEARDQARGAAAEREHEFGRLRRKVSEQGTELRFARDGMAALEAEVARLRAGADARLEAALAERDRERERAEAERAAARRAAAEVASARQAAKEARQGDEVRLALLLETLGGAVSGLRRELSLGGGGPRPADVVAGSGGVRGEAVVNPSALDAVLALPAAHLIVDGYNVSKTGYPELPLADQRTRLVTQLGALAARTGVEVTVVFDGAAVIAARPRGARGVRVLFSDAGVIADDVIRDLVAAEPQGRPLLVASSDKAVAESVRRRGAHSVPSSVLLGRLRA